MPPQRHARVPRALRPGEPIPDGPLADLEDGVFIEVVSRDVRRKLDPGRRAELRSDALRERWLGALDRLLSDVVEQIGIDPRMSAERRRKIERFRTELERRRQEALGAAVPERTAPGGNLRRRVVDLEQAIREHRDHECTDACDEACPADDRLWALV